MIAKICSKSLKIASSFRFFFKIEKKWQKVAKNGQKSSKSACLGGPTNQYLFQYLVLRLSIPNKNTCWYPNQYFGRSLLSPASIDRVARGEWKTEDPAFHKMSRLPGVLGGEGDESDCGDTGARDIGTISPVRQKAPIMRRVLPIAGKAAAIPLMTRRDARAVNLQKAKGAFHQSKL